MLETVRLFFKCIGNGWKAIGKEIDPKNLKRIEWQRQASEERSTNKNEAVSNVGKQVDKHLADVAKNLPTLLNCRDNSLKIIIEANLDEIGRMLGGWIKSTRER